VTYEYTPPKYAQIITELQRRIESGEYPAGSLLPSEHQLSGEFGTARPTVVRALRELRQAGWIDTQQGKGSFVRGRPALPDGMQERRGRAELERDESREPGELISVATAPAPARIAASLGLKPGTELVSRRRLIRQDNGEPSEIVTWWLPPGLAAQTGLGGTEVVRGSVLSLVARNVGIRIDTSSSKSPLAEPNYTRQSYSAYPRQLQCSRFTPAPGTPPAIPYWFWTSPCPVTCTNWKTLTRSAKPELIIRELTSPDRQNLSDTVRACPRPPVDEPAERPVDRLEVNDDRP
jgi:DNA-binding GntR family transcriptional regulator